MGLPDGEWAIRTQAGTCCVHFTKYPEKMRHLGVKKDACGLQRHVVWFSRDLSFSASYRQALKSLPCSSKSKLLLNSWQSVGEHVFQLDHAYAPGTRQPQILAQEGPQQQLASLLCETPCQHPFQKGEVISFLSPLSSHPSDLQLADRIR